MADDDKANDSIYGNVPPLADAQEERELRKLDEFMTELREQIADANAARSGSQDAARRVLGKDMAEAKGATRFDYMNQARDVELNLQRQLEMVTRQRGEIQHRAENRIMARAQAETRKLPAADQRVIAELQNDPDAMAAARMGVESLREQLVTLAEQGDGRAYVDTAVELRTQAQLLDAVDFASGDPVATRNYYGGLPGVNASAALDAIRSTTTSSGIMNVIAPPLEPAAPAPGATVAGPSMGVPGGPALPGGLERQPSLSPVADMGGGGPQGAGEIVAPAGQQLAFTGDAQGIQGGLIPQGSPAIAPALASLPGLQFGMQSPEAENVQAPTGTLGAARSPFAFVGPPARDEPVPVVGSPAPAPIVGPPEPPGVRYLRDSSNDMFGIKAGLRTVFPPPEPGGMDRFRARQAEIASMQGPSVGVTRFGAAEPAAQMAAGSASRFSPQAVAAEPPMVATAPPADPIAIRVAELRRIHGDNAVSTWLRQKGLNPQTYGLP